MSNNIDAEYARSVLDYDPESGYLSWKTQVAFRVKPGDEAGWIRPEGYREVSLLGKSYKVHRVAFLLVNGEWPKFHVDHINGVRDDNRWENLRDVPRRINNENQRQAAPRSKVGLLGVRHIARLKHNPYNAQIKVKGKVIALGCYPTPEEAHAVYLCAKRSLHEGCTI